MAIRSLSAPAALDLKSKETRDLMTLHWLLTTLCIGFLVCTSTGCTSGSFRRLSKAECVDDFMVGYRNRAMAEKAWFREKHRFCNRKFEQEFKRGFIDGYMEVASGGDGCTPAVAPSHYWSWRYQSGQGQLAMNAWFEGYPMGVSVAEQDGIGNWRQLRPMGIHQPTPVPMMPIAAGGGLYEADGTEASAQPTAPNPFDDDQAPEPEPDSEMEMEDSEDGDDEDALDAFQGLDLDGDADAADDVPPEPEAVLNGTEAIPFTGTRGFLPNSPQIGLAPPSTSESDSTIHVAQVPQPEVASFSDRTEVVASEDEIGDIFAIPAEGVDQVIESINEADELPFSFE